MILADIADVNPQTDVSRLARSDLVSFIPMADLSDDGRWLGSETRQFSAVQVGYTRFHDGDVLLAKITPCMENGKGCLATELVGGLGFGSTEFHILRAKPDADAQYLFQWTKSKAFRQKAANAMTGSAGQQRVPADFIRRFVITEHSSEEQAKIGQVLATVDRAIEQTEALLAKQQRIKIGLMHDLLTRGLDAQGRLRDPATDRFKPSPLGPIPVEWDTKFISSVSTFVTSGPRGWGRHYAEAGAKFIRIGNLTRDHVNLHMDALKHVSPPEGAEGIRTRLHAGDVLISITADLGLVGLVPDGFGEAYINQHIALVRPNKSEIVPGWMANFLAGHRMQTWIANINESGAKAGINLPTVRSLPVTTPAREEQKRIAELLATTDDQINETAMAMNKTRRLKSGLMQDLLSGRVPVTSLLAEVSLSALRHT